VLDLNHDGTDVVAALVINNVVQPAGIYDSSHPSLTGAGAIEVLGSAGGDYTTWAASFLPADVSDPTLDFDNDGLTNLQEFAFGTNPTQSTTGPIGYVNGGAVTTPGSPDLLSDAGTYYAVFGRRTDYIAAGLTYTVEFSAELSSAWIASAATPTVLATGGELDAVSVPFPGLIATDSGPQKARFFRVGVALAP
jgi:hypothetical protein